MEKSANVNDSKLLKTKLITCIQSSSLFFYTKKLICPSYTKLYLWILGLKLISFYRCAFVGLGQWWFWNIFYKLLLTLFRVLKLANRIFCLQYFSMEWGLLLKFLLVQWELKVAKNALWQHNFIFKFILDRNLIPNSEIFLCHCISSLCCSCICVIINVKIL